MNRPDGLLTSPFAHRGLWSPDGAPENSLSAIKAACDAGYGVEFDVRLTADDQAVVFHDDRLDRMCGRDAYTADLSAAELHELPLLGGPDRIPSLREVLHVIDGSRMALIEIKTPHAPDVLEDQVARALDHYLGPFAVISFNPASLAWFAEHRPHFPRGLDASGPSDEMLARSTMQLEELFEGQLDYAQPDFLVLNVDMVGGKVATRHRAQGRSVVAWTVKSMDQVAAIADHVDNYIFEGFTP